MEVAEDKISKIWFKRSRMRSALRWRFQRLAHGICAAEAGFAGGGGGAGGRGGAASNCWALPSGYAYDGGRGGNVLQVASRSGSGGGGAGGTVLDHGGNGIKLALTVCYTDLGPEQVVVALEAKVLKA